MGSDRLVNLCPFVVGWTAGLNGVTFWRDSITETSPTLVARNVNFLRGRLRRPARGPDFS